MQYIYIILLSYVFLKLICFAGHKKTSFHDEDIRFGGSGITVVELD